MSRWVFSAKIGKVVVGIHNSTFYVLYINGCLWNPKIPLPYEPLCGACNGAIHYRYFVLEMNTLITFKHIWKGPPFYLESPHMHDWRLLIWSSYGLHHHGYTYIAYWYLNILQISNDTPFWILQLFKNLAENRKCKVG